MKRRELLRNKKTLREYMSSNKRRNKGMEDLPYIDPQKYKIRGWRGRAAALDSWGESIQNPYLRYWESSVTDYMSECYKVSPWYGFYGYRKPPVWFVRKLCSYFIKAYDCWNEALSTRGDVFDLYIRLYDPHFILCSLEARRMQTKGQQYVYWPRSSETKPFPAGKFFSEGVEAPGFKWVLHDEERYIFESELEDDTTVEMLLKDGYKLREGNTEPYFAKKIGDVWIGRKIDASQTSIEQYFAKPVSFATR